MHVPSLLFPPRQLSNAQLRMQSHARNWRAEKLTLHLVPDEPVLVGSGPLPGPPPVVFVQLGKRAGELDNIACIGLMMLTRMQE